ncbi:MAG: diaminopimelate epimerase [bacterium]|nr:diaminopimelate epimerase [bacterium]
MRIQRTSQHSDTKLSFEKIHGAGNDFIVIDGRYGLSVDPSQFAQAACDRHFGIGSDGLVILDVSNTEDFRMHFFNPDGSRAVCGNGMRALALFVTQNGLLPRESKDFSLETDRGRVVIQVSGKGGRAKVNMGAPEFDGRLIPHTGPGEWISRELDVEGQRVCGSAVSMGNPHFVIFVEDVSQAPVTILGPLIEHHQFFPQRTNIEFVQIVSPEKIKMRVWERGAGETLACGTGVCAVVAVGVKTGKMERQVQVSTPGGEFEVLCDPRNENIFLTGPAEQVYSGVVDPQVLLTSLKLRQDANQSGFYL